MPATVLNGETVLVWISQTTLSVDETMETVRRLRERFPQLQDPPSDDICYATQNRQDAVKFMAPQSDLVLVVGSVNSSNSNRLREVAELLKVPAYLIDNAEAIDPAWIVGKQRIGVTAGASAPEVLVNSVITRLKELGAASVRALEGVPEKVTFPLPRELQTPAN